jgi:3,4-dihydroxy 2-butanone 4-phosphate synthase/GTP cyclohydrolase II
VRRFIVDDKIARMRGDFPLLQKSDPEMINFMATHGVIDMCAPLTESRCKELGLHAMVSNNTDPMETALQCLSI